VSCSEGYQLCVNILCVRWIIFQLSFLVLDFYVRPIYHCVQDGLEEAEVRDVCQRAASFECSLNALVWP
jgi:hypothetical protein